MVISIALLGWGVAGTCLTLFRKSIITPKPIHFLKLDRKARTQIEHTASSNIDRLAYNNAGRLLPILFFLSGASMVLVNYLTQIPGISFDSYLLFTNMTHIWRFLLTAFLYMLPFFFGALALGIIFILYMANIGKIYCANLFGSGVGGLLIIGLSWILQPLQTPVLIAVLPLAGAVLVANENRKNNCRKPDPVGWIKTRIGLPIIIAVSLIILIIITVCFSPVTTPVLSEYKGLSRTLDMPGSKVLSVQNSPYGFVQTVSAPGLRSAPCLSLKYKKAVPVSHAVFINGDQIGSLIPFSDAEVISMFNFTTNALPYTLRGQKNVLILNAGTGDHIALALNHNAKLYTNGIIDAVEPNPIICSMLDRQLGNLNSTFGGPVTLHSLNSRSFLKRVRKQYDLIVMPSTNSFGGNIGLNAMQTQEHLTVEAINEMWNKLTPNGILAVSCWQDYPPRHTLKIPATLVEVLIKNGIKKPRKYLAAIKSWGNITFLLSKTPFRNSEIDNIKDFCKNMFFDPVILPGGATDGNRAYNLSDEVLFSRGIQKILDSDKSFLKQYEFNIIPATDDRPYFSQFIRWRFLPHLLNLYGKQNIAFIELGYLIVILTLFVLSAVAVLLIILPLFFIGWKGRKYWTLLYFGGIGIGYMFVEIVFIQYFLFYLGNAVYSASSVISAMLICSGAGSWFSDKKQNSNLSVISKFSIIVLLLIVYGLFLGNLLHASVGLPFFLKLIITFILAGFPAFFMGIPFPVGLKYLNKYSEEQVPWGWGINSCMSVISPVIAIVIAVEMGFSQVLFLAAAAYILPLLVSLRRKD